MPDSKTQDTISFRGDRVVWQNFMHQVRMKKKQVWEELEPLLSEYIKKHQR